MLSVYEQKFNEMLQNMETLSINNVNEVTLLGNKKGYEVVFLGEFYKKDGTPWHEFCLYNEQTGEEFYGSYNQCINFLGK